MKRIFLHAYDKQNLGDDLFVHAITKRYPDAQFYIWSSKENKATYRSLPNLKVVCEDGKLVHILGKLRASFVPGYRAWLEQRCRAVVFIGGSIFMEYENWYQILNWWEYEAQSYPLYIMGANFGPYSSEEFRGRLADIFQEVKDICFRDKYSFEKFSGVPTVRWAPDILLSYPMPKANLIKKQLFVSVIDCASRGEGRVSLKPYDDSYVTMMSVLLKRYLEDGFQLILASFCKAEGDEQMIHKLLKALGRQKNDSRIKVVSYDGTNAEDLTEAIACSEYILATRFHATILAIAAGRPVFPIVYSDKTIHTLNDIGFQGRYADLRSMETVSYEESRRNMDCPQDINTGELAANAQEHFAKLDALLQGM